MSKQLAHDLNDNKWRSQDINVTEEDSEVTFESLGLKPSVLSGLKANGFVRLSSVQLHAIPIGRCGLDLIVQSKSGTGKTCVFVVTALEVMELNESNAAQVLVVCPTREIAVQTNQVMSALGSHLPNFKSCPVIGGTNLKQDLDLLAKCQAVVGTPGRIRQLIEMNALKTQSIRLLVLDECDKLMDDNFKGQIDHIFESLPQNKQMIAVSATMTTDLANFLRRYMRTPVFVRLDADNPALIGVKQYYRITEYHHLNHINFDYKIEPLVEILKGIPFNQCLVFSNYQTRARMLCDKLNALNWKTTYISAEKCQTERLKAISKLKKYKCRILVSTDLTARGIDVENVNLVVNMDIPFDAQTYLHRIGRAGRFGTKGIAITMASSGREEEQFQKMIKDCKLKVEELKKPIPMDIWKMDDLSEELCDIENKTEKKSKAYESDPFRELFPELYDSDECDNEFNEMVRRYESLESDIKSKPEATNKSPNEPNVSQTEAKDYTELRKRIKKSSFVDPDFDQKAYLWSKGLFPQEIETFVHTSDSLNPKLLVVPLNESQNPEPTQEKTKEENPKEDSNREECQPNSNTSPNNIRLSSGHLSDALFPPTENVSNPFQYNQWMRRNLSFWMRMTDPSLVLGPKKY